MRGHLRTSPKIAVKVEGSLYHRSSGANGNSGQQQQTTSNILHPACVLNGSFISQTFQILYRNEDVSLSDMAQFRLHVLVDSHKVRTATTTTIIPLTSVRSLSFSLPFFAIDFFPPSLLFSLSSLSLSFSFSFLFRPRDTTPYPVFSLHFSLSLSLFSLIFFFACFCDLRPRLLLLLSFSTSISLLLCARTIRFSRLTCVFRCVLL